MTASTFIVVTGNPAISSLLELETGGFASPSHDGFALALWSEVNRIPKRTANVWMNRQYAVANAKKQMVRSFRRAKRATSPAVGLARCVGYVKSAPPPADLTLQYGGTVRRVPVFKVAFTSAKNRYNRNRINLMREKL
jgi:hypothetical protein